jgi:tetratricopeptide (TPR) repeat protein
VVVERFEEGQNLNFASPVTKLLPLLGRHDALALPEFGARTRDESSETSTLADELFAIGNRHYEADRYEEALERFLLALQSDSTHSGAAYNAALCEVELGNNERAALLFKQYLRQPHEEDQYHRQAVRWLAQHANGGR